MTRGAILVIAGVLLLVACRDDEGTKPDPVPMTDEALGNYCQMNIAEHDGPVAQIFRAGFDRPIWFSQVRDAIAYTRLPEETDDVTAFYVSDMGHGSTGTRPDPITWADAEDVRFVIGSGQVGGMGAPEAVPFADPASAAAFAASNGGRIVTLADIPDDYVLAPVDIGTPAPSAELGQ
jgi:copper chaperone NosL